MVETKTPKYWESLSQEGEIENNISIQVEKLIKKYAESEVSSIFNANLSFSDKFLKELFLLFWSNYINLSLNRLKIYYSLYL